MEEIKPELSVIPSPLNFGAGNYTFKLTLDYEDILAINGELFHAIIEESDVT